MWGDRQQWERKQSGNETHLVLQRCSEGVGCGEKENHRVMNVWIYLKPSLLAYFPESGGHWAFCIDCHFLFSAT